MIRGIAGALVAVALMAGQASTHHAGVSILTFEDLNGWDADDHESALEVFLETCPDLDDPDWSSLCALATQAPNARAFFELFFRPVLVEDGDPALFTGYFEPELDGALSPDSRFRVPLYAKPPELQRGNQWLTRAEIENGGALANRGLELAWVDDPVEAFFLQIQGSGRVRLPDGSALRLGYSAANGHPYRSIGQELVRRGVYQAHQVSADVIKNWVRRNPEEGRTLLQHNPSYVFFRRVTDVPADKGPLGAMNRSITALRTIAVDPKFTPLGAPVWIEKGGDNGVIRRLMIAQDTGSAIKGAQRADIFFGTGDAAGRAAGKVRDPGRMVVLLPIQRAFSLLPESQQ